MLLVWPIAVPIFIKLFLSLVVAMSLFAIYRRHWQNKKSINTLIWQTDGAWLLGCAEGEMIPVRLSPGTYAMPWLVVLNFKVLTEGRALSLVVLPDMLDQEMFRRLRVRLRLEAGSSVVSE
jgi:toxin CptA